MVCIQEAQWRGQTEDSWWVLKALWKESFKAKFPSSHLERQVRSGSKYDRKLSRQVSEQSFEDSSLPCLKWPPSFHIAGSCFQDIILLAAMASLCGKIFWKGKLRGKQGQWPAQGHSAVKCIPNLSCVNNCTVVLWQGDDIQQLSFP